MDKGYLSEDTPHNSKSLLLDRNKQKLEQHQFTTEHYNLLTSSKHFCMLPWLHLHGWTDGNAYPCCMADMEIPVGNLRKNTFEEVWNGESMNQLRLNMLQDKPSDTCKKCYELEKSSLFSLRNESNRNFAYAVDYIDNTYEDGSADPNIFYWDMRFSNQCNFSCRMCGPQFSSSWAKESNSMYNRKVPIINYTRGSKQLNWEMVEPYIDNLHKIYFAGGEPLMMEEHWRLIDELLKRGKTDVELIYNTNFSETKYKKRNIFETWKEFELVSVGASLDAMGARAEYIRKGTKWDNIVRNREEMLSICPTVDFFASATLQALNAYHIVDFHNEWIQQGLIETYDFHVNVLQGPEWYRLTILPQQMKEEVVQLYEDHIEKINFNDDIMRASNGFTGAINFLKQEDRTDLLPKFREEIHKYDSYRNENFAETFPELKELMNGL